LITYEFLILVKRIRTQLVTISLNIIVTLIISSDQSKEVTVVETSSCVAQWRSRRSSVGLGGVRAQRCLQWFIASAGKSSPLLCNLKE